MVDEAKKLWADSELLRPLPSDEEIRAGRARLETRNAKAKRDFEELNTALIDAAESRNL